MKETELWKKQKEMMNLDFMRRVENKCDPGMPDVYYMHQGNSGFIENKCEFTMPKRIKFQPSQPIWLDNYWRAGGHCYIFLYIKKENNIYLWCGNSAWDLNKEFDPKILKPVLKVRMNEKGWAILYDYFSGE